MTDAWKEKVVAAMAARVPPMLPAHLAAEFGVTRGLIHKFLKPIAKGGAQHSALVPRVCELLNIPPPTQPVHENARRARLDEILDRMNDAQLDGAIVFLETMTRK